MDLTEDRSGLPKVAGEVLIDVEAVSKTFSTADGELPVLDNISLSVQTGEVVALLGKSGRRQLRYRISPRLLVWRSTMDHHHQLAASLLTQPTFEVTAWNDPLCERGIVADSDDALVVLCPVLGPSSSLVLHRFARYASHGPTSWEPEIFAATFGMSLQASPGLPAKTIARLSRFGFVIIGPAALAVRTRLPRLTPHWLAALPAYLRDDPYDQAA